MGDWTQTHPTYKTSVPLAALTLTSGQHFGEKAIVFSYPALNSRNRRGSAGLPLRSEGQGMWAKAGGRRLHPSSILHGHGLPFFTWRALLLLKKKNQV